jgi:hypothetical protein
VAFFVAWAACLLSWEVNSVSPRKVRSARTLAAGFQPSEPLSIPVIATPHPGCKWWNRVAQKYGNKTGCEILAEFIATTTWR